MDMSLCMSCKGRHSLATCKAFLKKPFKERQDLYMTRGICFSCLNPGQMYGGQKGSICQNTKQCLKAQTNFQKHKSVYQNTKHFLKNTNQFLKAKINLPKHKSVYQNTNQFSWNTNQKTGHLRRDYQRKPQFFRVKHGDCFNMWLSQTHRAFRY